MNHGTRNSHYLIDFSIAGKLAYRLKKEGAKVNIEFFACAAC